MSRKEPMSMGVCPSCQKLWNEGSRARAGFHLGCFNWLLATLGVEEQRKDYELCKPSPLPKELEREIRRFTSGATRDADASKLHYEGYISPLVLLRYAVYMKKHEKQPDGSTRAPDNWQKGIPKNAYIESLVRHVITLWLHHDGYGYLSKESYQDSLCAIIFNASGLLFEDCRTDGFDPDTMDKLAKE